jgi:hypothetical protein
MAICSSERYGHHKQEQRVLLLRTIVKGSWYEAYDTRIRQRLRTISLELTGLPADAGFSPALGRQL